MPSAKLIFHDIEGASKSYRPKGALRIFILELPDTDFQDCSAVIYQRPAKLLLSFDEIQLKIEGSSELPAMKLIISVIRSVDRNL